MIPKSVSDMLSEVAAGPPAESSSRDEVSQTQIQPFESNNASITVESCTEVIKETWATLLRLEVIPIDTDFFMLGGDSILLVQSLSRVSKILGLDVPLTDVLEVPSVTVQNIAVLFAQRGGYLSG